MKNNWILALGLLVVGTANATTNNQKTIDPKEVASCSAIDGDLARLECFDTLSAKNGLNGLQAVPTETDGTGSWIVSKDINPVDDSQTVTMILQSESGTNKWGRKVAMVLRCSQNTTDMYINWGEYLGRDASVLTRVGSDKAETENWSLSTDSKASFKRKPIPMIKQMLGQSKFVAQITPYNESPVTAIFDINGIDSAIKPLRETCGW
ncbi:type VI secretion system-associated protein TagO [Photobacterium satsumensis]|uniref:type VI secretion system-associated protein TagO n=1 Tax=Photobacterium satsumensis TaxID=2910239 RepID=UPI003D0ECD4A